MGQNIWRKCSLCIRIRYELARCEGQWRSEPPSSSDNSPQLNRCLEVIAAPLYWLIWYISLYLAQYLINNVFSFVSFQVKSKYKNQLETLRTQLAELEDSRTQIRVENTLFKQEFMKMGKELPSLKASLGNGSSETPINLKKCSGNSHDTHVGPTTNGSNGSSVSTTTPIIGVTPKKLSRLRVLEEHKKAVVENGSSNGKSWR